MSQHKGAPRLLMTADAVGGVWQYATDLAAGLSAYGFETVLAVIGPPPDEDQSRRARTIPGVKLIETGLPLDWLADASSTRRTARALSRLAEREHVDLVHLNSPALAGAADWPVPVVAVAHGCTATWWEAARAGQPLDRMFHWHRRMTARGIAAADCVITPSGAYAQTVRRSYALSALPHVVHNGRTWPTTDRQSPPEPLVFTAGRLWDAVKNTPLLDAVAQRLSVPFEAAGPIQAPHGEVCEAQHLKLLGNLDGSTLKRRLARRPVFVSGALFEPFGLAVLEAAATGCALVLSDIPTFRELWEGAALFAKPDDPDDFVKQIENLLTRPQHRLAMGEAARSRAARYSVSRMAAAMAGHYRRLLRVTRPAAAVAA